MNNYLRQNKVKAEIHEISGSVEIAPGIGLADVVCDLVEVGLPYSLNGLKEVVHITITGCLIRNKKLDDSKLQLLNKLLFRVRQ